MREERERERERECERRAQHTPAVHVHHRQVVAGIAQVETDPREPACEEVIGAEAIGEEIKLTVGMGKSRAEEMSRR